MTDINNLQNKISIYVCTYNEENNIEACLKPWIVSGFDITVVDASDDKTQCIVTALGVPVVKTEKGLHIQRKVAFNTCKKDFLLFLDADDHLPVSSLTKMYEDLIVNGWAAVVPSKRVPSPRSYAQICMDSILRYCISRKGVTNAVGGNTLFKTDVMQDIEFGNSARGGDDTQMSIHIRRKQLQMGTSCAPCFYSWPASFNQSIIKFWYYGKGDCDTCLRFPDNYWKLIFHQVVRYPLIYSFLLIRKGHLKCVPFSVTQGLIRIISMHYELLLCGLKRLSFSSLFRKNG